MISVIIPCYNEEKVIYQSLKTVASYLESTKQNYEIIVSCIGCTDQTGKEVKRAMVEYERIVLVEGMPKRGKGNTVRRGVKAASGDVILFMDADLATHLEAIERSIEALEAHDVVIGSRHMKESVITKKQNLVRQFIGWSCRFLTNRMTGVSYKDTQCGFKAFKKDVANDLFKWGVVEGFAFDVELLYLAKLAKYKVKEIPVTWTDGEGSSVNIVKDSIRFFIELKKITRRKKQYQQKIKK